MDFSCYPLNFDFEITFSCRSKKVQLVIPQMTSMFFIFLLQFRNQCLSLSHFKFEILTSCKHNQ